MDRQLVGYTLPLLSVVKITRYFVFRKTKFCENNCFEKRNNRTRERSNERAIVS